MCNNNHVPVYRSPKGSQLTTEWWEVARRCESVEGMFNADLKRFTDDC